MILTVRVPPKNIALGYMDTMRAFGRLGGTAYGILPDENSFMQDFAAEYQAQLSAAISRAPNPGADRSTGPPA